VCVCVCVCVCAKSGMHAVEIGLHGPHISSHENVQICALLLTLRSHELGLYIQHGGVVLYSVQCASYGANKVSHYQTIKKSYSLENSSVVINYGL